MFGNSLVDQGFVEDRAAQQRIVVQLDVQFGGIHNEAPDGSQEFVEADQSKTARRDHKHINKLKFVQMVKIKLAEVHDDSFNEGLIKILSDEFVLIRRESS
jgi:hypothetical protein